MHAKFFSRLIDAAGGTPTALPIALSFYTLYLSQPAAVQYNQWMITITLELPDQLAAEIASLREELPVLLSITQQLFRPAGDGNLLTRHTPGAGDVSNIFLQFNRKNY